MNGDDTREWELSSAGRRQVREQRVKREARLETEIGIRTHQVKQLKQDMERAIINLCDTRRWLEETERKLASQIEELETLQGGE